MSINPDINPASSRPTTSAGSIRPRVNEEAAREIGRGFVAYLKRSGSPCRATCGCRRPSVAAAFIDGARAQGADVVDYGMMGTDMMYFAVARDGLDGGAQITASHNPEGIQRHQDGAPRRRFR